MFRVFKLIPHYVTPGAFAKFGQFLDYILPNFTQEGQPMTVWDWILSMPSRRRKQLVRVLMAWLERGEHSRDLLKFQAFVKTENLPYFAQTSDGPSVDALCYIPRLIQPPHDEAHLVAGPYLKPLVERLKEVWHVENWIFYGSASPEKLDHWLERIRHCSSFFWSDYSAFDATFSDEIWDFMESLYKSIYPTASDTFLQILKAWRRPDSETRIRREDAKVKFQADVCNASGRDDTALANAIFNGFALTISFAAAISGVTVTHVTPEMMVAVSELVIISVVGDDSLVGCNFDVRPLCNHIGARLEEFGLVAKVFSSTDLADVTYLGMMPYLVEDRLLWGPTLGRRLYKAFWQSDPKGNLPAWARGVAQQLALYRHVPVLFETAQAVLRCTEGFKSTPVAHDQVRPWTMRKVATPTWTWGTLEWLARRYRDQGLTTQAIRHDISTLASIRRVPCVVKLHSTDAALLVDDL